MLRTPFDRRIDSVITDCELSRRCVVIAGNMAVIAHYESRFRRARPSWFLRNCEVHRIKRGESEFPGVYVSSLPKDYGAISKFVTAGVGLLVAGMPFNPNAHPMSTHFAVTTGTYVHWEIAEIGPFLEKEFLIEVRDVILAKHPDEGKAAVAIVHKVIDDAYPDQPAANHPLLRLLTMRPRPVRGTVDRLPRLVAPAGNEALEHVAACCSAIQNTNYLQLLADTCSMSFMHTSNGWDVDDLSYGAPELAMPNMLWFQQDAKDNPVTLDPHGFGISLDYLGRNEQCTRGIARRVTGTEFTSVTTTDSVLSEVVPCLGGVPKRLELFHKLLRDTYKADEERLFRGLVRDLHSAAQPRPMPTPPRPGVRVSTPKRVTDCVIWRIRKSQH